MLPVIAATEPPDRISVNVFRKAVLPGGCFEKKCGFGKKSTITGS